MSSPSIVKEKQLLSIDCICTFRGTDFNNAHRNMQFTMETLSICSL